MDMETRPKEIIEPKFSEECQRTLFGKEVYLSSLWIRLRKLDLILRSYKPNALPQVKLDLERCKVRQRETQLPHGIRWELCKEDPHKGQICSLEVSIVKVRLVAIEPKLRKAHAVLQLLACLEESIHLFMISKAQSDLTLKLEL